MDLQNTLRCLQTWLVRKPICMEVYSWEDNLQKMVDFLVAMFDYRSVGSGMVICSIFIRVDKFITTLQGIPTGANLKYVLTIAILAGMI